MVKIFAEHAPASRHAGDTEAYMRAAIEGELSRLSGLPPGAQDNEMTSVAWQLARMVKGWSLSETEIKGRFFDCCRGLANEPGKRAWTAKDFERKWQSAIRDAPARPLPPSSKAPSKGQKLPENAGQIILTDLPLPEWTKLGDGVPAFQDIGKNEPSPVPNEVRRHVYPRAGKAVRVRIKKADGVWIDFYHVQRSSDGKAGWQAHKPEGFMPVPYGNVEAFGSAELYDKPIFVTEGEKDCDALTKRGGLAFTFGRDAVKGSQGMVSGRDVIVLGDNDKAGRDYANRQAEQLNAAARSLKVFTFPDLPEQGDVSDFLEGHSIGDLYKRAHAAPNWTPPTPFPVECCKDVTANPAGSWLIEKLLPLSGLALIYGLPKHGKSCLALDALFHVAMGLPWAGAEVKGGAVFYFTAEGRDGFRRRLMAMRSKHEVENIDIPFSFVSVAPNLGEGNGDVQKVIETVKNASRQYPHAPVRAIVIDTLSRSMPGRDENSAKDMSTFISNCETIAKEFDCLVVVLHHSGKDSERGPRGSNSLSAAADATWYVRKLAHGHRATVDAMKDGEEGLEWSFDIVPYALPGETENPGTVELLSEPQSPGASKTMTEEAAPKEKALLDIIRSVLDQAGADDGSQPELSPNRVTRKAVMARAIEAGWMNVGEKERSKFNQTLERLAIKRRVGKDTTHLWLLPTRKPEAGGSCRKELSFTPIQKETAPKPEATEAPPYRGAFELPSAEPESIPINGVAGTKVLFLPSHKHLQPSALQNA